MRWKTDTYSGWGRALKAEGELARPERISALKALPLAPAMGARRSYGDAALNDSGRAVDMTRLDRIIGFDPETGLLEAEAGLSIAEMVRIFVPRGFLPAVMPGTGFATLGGCIAMDVHGKNHHHDGSFGAHVEEIRLLRGGKDVVISREKQKEVFRATLGGLGQTGVIMSAKIRLREIPGPSMQVQERRAESLEEHLNMLDASQARYTVGWLDATAKGAAMGRGIVEEAEHGHADAPAEEKAKSVPVDAPRFALSKPVVKAFNAQYYRRIPEGGQRRMRSIPDFFFPLDRIHDWNKLYGKRGFHQFQCVIPLSGRDALRGIVEAIASSGLASPLAVLKRLGPEGEGMLSFPMEGYTLAVDFPARAKTPALIEKLIALTAEAGGRIYLAKDSLADGASVRAMYPGHAKWAAIAAKGDPAGALQTDLTRRLGLRSAT
ncbi:FAD-binding oxidoreductase [Rhodalgimonas zhirmunskyi]|uniref:FAD-binding oxidoreductase n=1 Tax=Rhodalgimonas zhirmunskyi TaxID=2964767 RepID=A0AAJ1U518_9RHOB|nr:FAD-binding oxidoreductase [Rhodoalgimonas zhirmunskyi]MDQ2093766.1 FAD-binding oxidoreductase [Rhodoalgimonas zhirmunskyi]